MLPNFNEHGFLPEGVWDGSLEEIRSRFAIFSRSDRRLKLFDALAQLLEETLATGWVKEVIIDGSFVTSKAEPNDVDLILALSPEFVTAEAGFWTRRTLDSKFLHRKYRFDVKIAFYETLKYSEILDFFQKVEDSELRKGVVRLKQ